MPPSSSKIGPSTRISLQTLLDANSAGSSSSPPLIDLNWEPFEANIKTFLSAIDTYTQQARTAIGSETRSHIDRVKTLKGHKEMAERSIQMEGERERDMLSELENERQTVINLNGTLSHLQRTLEKVKAQSAAVEAEITAAKKEVNVHVGIQERQRSVLKQMRLKDEEELKGLQETLGLHIHGVREGILLMRFTLVDPADPDREFSLLLDVSQDSYTVPNCSPSLSVLAELVRQLNADRNLFDFIRRVRRAFKATVPDRVNPSQYDALSASGMRTPGHRRVFSQSHDVLTT